MKKEFKITEIQKIAKGVISLLSTDYRLRTTACVLALSGDLGAGKTTLSQSIARELGVKENIISPTFVIMKMYEIPKKLSKLTANKLIHIDAYRLEKDSELLHLGWEEMLADPQNLILIEWPERVKNLIPKDAIKVSLSHIDESKRKIQIEL